MPGKTRKISASGRDQKDSARALVELGLTQSEARAYVTLLHGGLMTAAEVASGAAIARPKVYEASPRSARS